MHLLIPFAAPLSEGGRQALRQLALPALAAGLAACAAPTAADRDDADPLSFSPPHERALARLLGLAGGDGGLPWAACRAVRDGRQPGDLAWGLMTPAHWHLGSDHITMGDPDDLGLDAAQSQALLDAVQDLFVSEGIALVYGAPTRWYVAHESLAGLRTASLDRVIGRNVDPWLTAGPEARLWRRLQNELQMRLYEHPLNQAREARGALPVNSFWLSGCGPRQTAQEPGDLVVDTRLRRPAVAEDWAVWSAAWRALDAGPVAAWRDQPGARLTLCGEQGALTLTSGSGTAWQRLLGRWRQPAPADLLETL